jgi:hypothetical protein
MKSSWRIALVFWFAGAACAEAEAPQLPDLETTDDLRAFVEQGVICAEAWSAHTLFARRPDFAALKRLEAAARKIGTATQSSFAEDHYFLNIRPGKNKMTIHGFDADNISIGAYDSISFAVRLNANKKAVLDQLRALGLYQHPFDHPVGDVGESYFRPASIADHMGAIVVVDHCEQAKAWDEGNQKCQAEKMPTPYGSWCWAAQKHGEENRARNKACQAGKISVALGCVWHEM